MTTTEARGPRPFYQDGSATLYCGDCRTIAPMLDSGSFDVAICDPPYGTTKIDWDSRDLSWLTVCDRVVKDSGSVWCFGSMRMFMEQASAIEALGWRPIQDVVWEKHNGSNFHADRFRRVHEHVIQFVRETVRWADVYKCPVTTPDAVARSVRRTRRPAHMGDVEQGHYVSEDGGPRLMRSVIPVRSCHGAARHPTEKPLGILIPLIEYSCPPGGRVFDPTCGVGSTLVAAKSLGRVAVGIELSTAYCEIAAGRLTQQMPGVG